MPSLRSQRSAYRSSGGAAGYGPWPVLFAIFSAIYVVSLIIMPVVYDTLHMTDTLFMLNSGWRVFLGLRPGIDYDSFYSGLTSRYLALSFRLFGLQARALDLSVLLQYVTILPLAFLAMAGRVSLLTLSIMGAVLATILLTRAPLEEYASLTQLMAAHSFSYNRLGLALCLVPLLAALLPPGTRRQESLAGLAAGVAIAMALMAKWSFLTVLPPTIVALALQRRWLALGSMLFGLTVMFLLLDPMGQQFLGTLSYVRAAAGAEDGMGGIGGLLFKMQRTVLSHIIVVLALIAALIWTLRVKPGHRWAWSMSVLVMTLGLGVACLLMGPFGLVGHQILPVAVTLLVIFAEQIRRHDPARDLPIRALAVILALGLVLPHLGNAMLVTAAAFGNRGEDLIVQGPMIGYLQRYSNAAPGRAIDEINTEIAAEVARAGEVTRALEYPVFADGLAALQRLSPQGQHGIIAEGLINFEFSALAPPVTDYPLWPRVTSPEFAGRTRIPEDVDIVMLLRQGTTPFGGLLRSWMGSEFQPCLKTPIWDLYVRTGAGVTGCSVDEPRQS